MSGRSCDLGELAPALALDALESEEREAIEAHIRHCLECAQEVRAYREVAAQFALSLPQHEPPPDLEPRILAAARGEAAPGGTASFLPEPGPAPAPRPTWLQRIGPALSVAALAAALAALVWGASLQSQLGAAREELAVTRGQLERVRTNYGTIVRVLSSTATSVHELEAREGAPNAQGRLWVDPQSGRGMMMARDLPELSPSESYQVWLLRGEERVSAGFLRPSEDGSYYLVLQAPGNLSDYERIGVTREPDGGSPGPTGPRIIGGNL